jgi:hypothetical protein
MVKINVIDYIVITCNLKNDRLQITYNYMKKCNRLQLITITPCLITTNIVNSNPAQASCIQYNVMKIVSDLRQLRDFLRVIRFPQPIQLTTTI